MRKIPEVLDSGEKQRLLAVPNIQYPSGLRNLCLMRVMLDAGLKVSEVVNLKVTDIDWATGLLMVRQLNGKKDRGLLLGKEDLMLLGKWRARKPESPFLFTTLKGNRLDPRYIRAMVKRCAEKAGIAKDIHPHTLRHTFATDLYRETNNLVLTSKALGHASLSTTQIYTRIVGSELDDAIRGYRLEATAARPKP